MLVVQLREELEMHNASSDMMAAVKKFSNLRMVFDSQGVFLRDACFRVR